MYLTKESRWMRHPPPSSRALQRSPRLCELCKCRVAEKSPAHKSELERNRDPALRWASGARRCASRSEYLFAPRVPSEAFLPLAARKLTSCRLPPASKPKLASPTACRPYRSERDSIEPPCRKRSLHTFPLHTQLDLARSTGDVTGFTSGVSCETYLDMHEKPLLNRESVYFLSIPRWRNPEAASEAVPTRAGARLPHGQRIYIYIYTYIER